MRSASDLGIPGFETVSVLVDSRDTIIRARKPGSDDEVVIKLLDRAKEPVLPSRLNRSRRQLLKITDQNIGLIPLLDHGVASDGRDYVITPYFPIGSLQDQVDHGPTPWYLAAEIIAEVAGIVSRAHDDNIVLGDLRPSSIFLEAVGKPAVAAFGVATRRFDDGGAIFVAPEASNDRPERSPASDVYSLALVLAALIAGRPWGRNEAKEAFMAEVRAASPTRIIDVIEHGLSISPTNRYRNAGTLRRAIRSAVDADPDRVKVDGEDEPFDFDSVFEPVGDNQTKAATRGIPFALNPESLPPGLEDITFVYRDGDDTDATETEDVEGTADGEAVDICDGTDLIEALDEANEESDDLAIDITDGAVDGATVKVPDEFDLAQATQTLNHIDLRDNPDNPNSIESDDESSSNDADSPADADDCPADADAIFDNINLDETDPFGTGADDTLGPPPARGDGSTRSATSTLVRDAHAPEEIDRPDKAEDRSADELVSAEAITAADDETSVLDLDELAEGADADADETLVLDLDELSEVEETEDTANDEAPADDITDDTVDDDEVLDQTPVDATSTSTFTSAPATFATEATEAFGETDDADSANLPAPAAFVPGQGDEAGDAFDGVVGPDGTPLEEVPFRGVAKVRAGMEEPTFLSRTRTSAELLWFRRRRSLGTLAALLGIAVIVGFVIYFLAQEVRSSATIATEGVSRTTTTIGTTTTQIVANDPSVTVPSSTTTVPPPRRPAAPPAAPAVTDEDSEPNDDAEANDEGETGDEAETGDEGEQQGDGDSESGDDADSGGEPENEEPTGDSGGDPEGEEPEEEEPEGEEPTDEGSPTTEALPPDTEAPPATEPPDTEPPAPARPSIGLSAGGVGQRNATVSLSSDQCVASRYVLTGQDGSTFQGSSAGFDPAAQCSTAWDLRFNRRNGSRLEPATTYTLKVWINALDTNTTNSSSITFTTQSG